MTLDRATFHSASANETGTAILVWRKEAQNRNVTAEGYLADNAEALARLLNDQYKPRKVRRFFFISDVEATPIDLIPALKQLPFLGLPVGGAYSALLNLTPAESAAILAHPDDAIEALKGVAAARQLLKDQHAERIRADVVTRLTTQIPSTTPLTGSD